MLTIKDGKKILTTPVSAEDLKDIHIGDVVYLNGDLTTCRDVAHRRLVEEGRPLPVDVKDAAIFHAGPIIRPLEDDKFEMVSVGPTTSMRMEKFEYEFVQKSGVRVIVGKGGMGPNTERACKEFGAIHCVFPAGNAVVAATEVEEIVEAQWRDLGMPETLWHCHVNEFGPLIVSIDAEGRNLFEENKVIFNERKEKAIEYEEYLKRIAALAINVQAGKAADAPEQLNTPGRLALYNNLKDHMAANKAMQGAATYGVVDAALDLALRIDAAVKQKHPDS